MAGTRVLVTGASGVAGRAVVHELKRSGYEAIGVDSARADLTRKEQAEELLETIHPDYVIHLAGRVHGLMGNIHSQGDAFYDNIQINTNVVEASRKVGVEKIVAMGSTAVYSDSVSLPMREDDLWLGAPHDSERGYAHAKRAMEAQLEAYRDQYGMDFAFVVSTNLYGPGDKFDEAHGHVLPSLVSKVYRAQTSGEPLEVWGTGNATRDFLYSADAASAIRTILEHYSGVINLATGVSVTIREAVETLVRVSGYSGTVTWDASKPDGQHARSYDISRLKALGWAPEFTLEQGLAETHRWYVENFATARR
ncbi:GDP-L-fucose synthase [Cellulomonas sp. P24]|uniref:GDP-L-fucose synthase family protein n=1 Tax=Cellulomonas sp. P24 TaxID=2885206 RepID=UPI00216AE895|nr:GDP-L-fucose synthase [Cellulomonas sp. P24]MCR6491744.1 GDP-L-fucose synthase [Cellulomonas sp. P24]